MFGGYDGSGRGLVYFDEPKLFCYSEFERMTSGSSRCCRDHHLTRHHMASRRGFMLLEMRMRVRIALLAMNSMA